LISLDNVGVWNLRTENLDSWYLGQETYVKVVNPEDTNKTELPIPDNALFCGALNKMQKYVTVTHLCKILSISSETTNLIFYLFYLFFIFSNFLFFLQATRYIFSNFNHGKQIKAVLNPADDCLCYDFHPPLSVLVWGAPYVGFS
jgi:hypothetical protein